MRLPASFLALAATLLLADAQNTGPSCSDRMDIVLVIDGSESIGTDNFQKVRSATEAFARQAFNRIQNLRLGIVVYGTIVEQSIYPSSNREEVFQTLENLAYPVNGGTYTDLGIETAKALLNTTSNIRAMVVLTDGLSRYPDDTEKAANVAKSEGITVYSVGVTLDSRLFPQRIIESYTLELDRIATSPQNRLSIDNFDQLSILASGLLNQVCVTQLTVTSGLVDQTIFVGDTLTLVARMSESGLQDILWFKGNTRLPSDPRITYSSSGFEHRLTITNAQQSDSGTYTLTINGVSTYGQVTVQGNSNPGSTAVCRENIDVFLAIDGSNSINPDPFEFELLPAVVSFVDEMFNRTQNGLRMGYVLYSRIINSEVNLSGSDAFIRSSLLGETYPNAITNTHLALNRIKDLFDAQTTDSAKVVMVITDGASDDLAATAQAALNLKAAGVQIIAVGVGDLINQEELRGLASSPDMVILVENFQSLATQLLNITSQCNGVFSSWTEQSRTPCTVPCGGGNQIVTRTRTCSGGSCVGPTSETFSVNCNTATCTLLQRFVDIEVYEGDTFELVAVFGEANIPGATWTKGGSAIFNGGRFTTSGTGFDQTLRVTSTQMTDAGQYVLSVGGVTTFATVTVLQRQGVFTAWTDVSRSACSAPCNSGTQTVFRTRTCQSGTCSGPTSETITENCNTGPCTVLQRLINIQVTEGDTFSLTAVFREANIPGARWTKGGVVVNSNGRFSITGTGTDQTLRVTNSQLGDAGQYTLSVGGVTTLATVTVVPRNTARAVCQGSLDIFLAIDGSNSINPDPFEFDLLPALVSFIEEMFTRTTDLRMGYVLYSTILRGELDLTADSSLLSQSVAGLQYPNGVTNTHLALDRIDTLFTANNRDAAKVVIIITDGASDDRNRTAAAATTLKNKDVQVMAVGVGDLIDQQELINLASSPVMVVLVSDFAQLASQLTNISNQCSGVAVWSEWISQPLVGTPCSRSCGGGTQQRTYVRRCNSTAFTNTCPGSSRDVRNEVCNTQGCPTAVGQWGLWSVWTPGCPLCGSNPNINQQRTRDCVKASPTDLDCPGNAVDNRVFTCTLIPCQATWNNWGQWSNPGCPTCGLSITRTVTRTRTCNQVAGQAFCSGSSTDSVIRTCSIPNCRGTWAAWASWATPNCPACGPVGTQRQVTRNRLCNKLLTTYDDCIGSGSDSRFDTCLIPVCTATWNTWGSWVDPGCPTCGLNVTRTASRTRTCNQLSGQTFCSGSSFGTEVRTCTIPNCIGTWGAWTSWTQPNCPSCGPSGTTSSVSRSRICSKVQPTDTDCPGLNTQSRFDACSIPICTATWNTWGSWVDPGCPTCGLGITRTAIRTRTCNQLAGQQSCIGSSFGSEVRTCTIPNCIGVWTQWANWVVTGCPACNPSGQTNTGTFTRVRTCNKVATTYADCPGSSTETKTDTCNVATCRVGTWTAWTAWSVGNCSICGTNVTTQQTRTRTCFKTNTADTDCPGTTSETRTSVCQISPCQATWNTWGSWVDPGCPTCGLNITRTASRTRTCNQLSGQTFCPGSSFGTEVRTCNIPNCIGTWTAWASWTTPNCPTCGPVGTQRRVTRNRVCNKVLTTYDDCIGSGSDSRFDTCSIPVCTATWNTWGQWSNPGCPSCGLSITRTVTRTRTCDQVAGQAFCSGSSTDSVIRTCSIPNCRGTWTAWASWATPNCPACGPVGTQRQVTRNRVCNKVLTTYDDCIGSGSDSRFDTCSIPVCTVTWNNWGQWSNPGCPSCGLSITRTVTRTRTCDQVAGQTFCSGPSTDSVIRTCSIPNCRGTWTAWASWATPNCPSCGPVGTQRQVTRNRVCNKVLTTYDDCIGSGSDSRFDTCSMPLCTATWNNWGQWSNPGCPSCGLSITRTVTRTRTCNQVAGQAFCPGPRTDSDIRTCNIPNCRGTWSAWASWNLPSCPSCGPPSTVRRVSRTRVCNKDLSTHSNCAGNNVEYRNDACNVANCTVTPGLCASVMNVSGVGYRYHPTDCDKYVQCYFNPNGEVSAVYRTCPFGHYWSQATMRCDHSWKVTCPHEKCNNTCVTTYNMEGSCRAYWSCDHGRSQAECCAVGFRYVSGRGCFPDLNCRDACPTPCTSADICDKAPAWDKPENYKLNVGFLGWMDSGCIPGSYFDILECGCNVRKNDTCNPEFSLTFNNQNAIAAAKGDWLTLDTVNITNGVAAFTGLGKLVADVKLPEAGVGCPAVLRFRYRENGSGGRQVLASSSDCRHGNTMIIAIHNNTLIFELTSWYGTLLSMPISTMGLAPSQWKDVTFMYNGKVLTGVIKQDNYKVMGQLFAPKVDLVACGLTFGSDGSVLTAFDGQLDEINLYKCDPGNLY
ncbi:uncharacterized protein [Haliotis cracherodii]|uniref:uncharacterized protein isoform X6 n=1 Tax=Haliotis cracherodii TaxID=6455 RepID=UPI0039EC16E0